MSEKKNAKKVNVMSLLSRRDSDAPPKEICVQTVQKSVPIAAVHEKHNLIEAYPGCFSKSYSLQELNFQSSTIDEQELTMSKYRAILNSFGSNMEVAITIFNRNVNLEQFSEEALLKETGDEFDYLRRELNGILLERISDGQNGLRKDKYITLALHADSLKKAVEVFEKRLDDKLNADLKGILSSATP